MAGSELGRGIPKYHETDREGQLVAIKTVFETAMLRLPYIVDTTWGTVPVQPSVGTVPQKLNFFLQPSSTLYQYYQSGFPVPIPSIRDVQFGGINSVTGAPTASPGPIPSALNAFQAEELFYGGVCTWDQLYQGTIPLGHQGGYPIVGNSFHQLVENTTGAAVVVSFPQAVTSVPPGNFGNYRRSKPPGALASLTIPANTTLELTWEIVDGQQSAPVYPGSINFGPLIRLLDTQVQGSGTVSSLTTGLGIVAVPNPITTTGVISAPITSTGGTITVTQSVNGVTNLEAVSTGTVITLNAGNGVVLTPNPITTVGSVAAPITSATLTVVQSPNAASTINLPASGAGAGSTVWSNLTRDVQGRITAASSGTFTSPYGIAITPTATGFTAAANISWMTLNVSGLGGAGQLVASGAAVPLFAATTTTNDPATFTYPGSGGANTFNLIVGTYQFFANFVTNPNAGDGDSFAFTTSPITLALGSAFGKFDGAYTASTEQNRGMASTSFIFPVNAPATLQLSNVSTFPAHTLTKGNLIGAVTSTSAGYISIIRLG